MLEADARHSTSADCSPEAELRRLGGMANANARFCQIDFLSYESTAQQRIHILGDAIQPASLMPKSGHMLAESK